MFFELLSGTPGGRYSVIAVIAAMVALPIINGLLTAYPGLQAVLILIVAVVVGLAIGWVVGAYLAGQTITVRAIGSLGAIVVAIIGLYTPIKKAVEAAGGVPNGSIIYEIFVRPFETGSLTGAIQYAVLSAIVMAVVAYFQ